MGLWQCDEEPYLTTVCSCNIFGRSSAIEPLSPQCCH